MINRLIHILYYILFFSLVVLLISYFAGWFEILEVLNKAFFLTGGIIFLSVIFISKKNKKAIKIALNSISFVALIFWTGALLGFFDFKFFALFSFKILLSCLIVSLFFKFYSHKKIVLKVLYIISTIYLLVVFNLTSYGYFSSDVNAILSLTFFSLFTVTFAFYSKLGKPFRINE